MHSMIIIFQTYIFLAEYILYYRLVPEAIKFEDLVVLGAALT